MFVSLGLQFSEVCAEGSNCESRATEGGEFSALLQSRVEISDMKTEEEPPNRLVYYVMV